MRNQKGTLNLSDPGTKAHFGPRLEQLLKPLHPNGVDVQNSRRVGGIDRMDLITEQVQRRLFVASLWSNLTSTMRIIALAHLES